MEKENSEIFLAAVKNDGMALHFVPTSLQTLDIVREAVKNNGLALQFAGESFKKDLGVVVEAIKNNSDSLKFADESMQFCRQVISLRGKDRAWGLAMKLKPDTPEHHEAALAVAEYGYFPVRFLNDKFKEDRQFIIFAVQQDGLSLESAHPSLKKDKDVVIAAVATDFRALIYADNSLIKDRDVILAALKNREEYENNKENLNFFNWLKSDSPNEEIDIIKESILSEIMSLEKDRDVMLEVVKCDGLHLKSVDVSLYEDSELLFEAVKNNGLALEYICFE